MFVVVNSPSFDLLLCVVKPQKLTRIGSVRGISALHYVRKQPQTWCCPVRCEHFFVSILSDGIPHHFIASEFEIAPSDFAKCQTDTGCEADEFGGNAGILTAHGWHRQDYVASRLGSNHGFR